MNRVAAGVRLILSFFFGQKSQSLLTSAASRGKQPVAQIRSFDQTHAEVMLVLVLADFIDRHDFRCERLAAASASALKRLTRSGVASAPALMSLSVTNRSG